MLEQYTSIPQQIGHYMLLRLLGRGGFADVYLGEHIHLKTLAAVKILHSRLSDEDVQQFAQEAQTVARLVHPHIVRVLDFGVEHSFPYLVMDYAPNGTLRSKFPLRSRVPLEVVVSLTHQIAEALHYAHTQRLIHRDIKPENLLLGRNNEILLSDFGIALVMQSSRLQNTQNIAGTIAYMAPEQIAAHPIAASDQYSLGIIVYEWLCGTRPFHGSYSEIAVKQAVTPPQPLRTLAPDVPYQVEYVVMTALHKEPTRRFPNVLMFAQALEQAFRASSQSLPETSANFPFLQQRQKDASAHVTYATEFANAMMPSSNPYMSPIPGYQLRQDLAQQPYPSLYAPQLPYRSQVLTQQSGKQNHFSRRTFLIGGSVAAGAALVGGATVWSLLSSRKDSSLSNGQHLPMQIGNTSNGSSSVLIRSLIGHGALVLRVRWSPDGAYLASGSVDGTVIVWTANNGQGRLTSRSTRKPPMADDYPWSLDWSPLKSSPHLAIGFVDGTIQVLDASSNQRISTHTTPASPTAKVAWSPDEQYIAVAGGDNVVHVYAYPSWRVVTTYQEHTDIVTSVAWSPDGKSIASSSEDMTVRIWAPFTGTTKLICSGHTEAVSTVEWSYDSKYLVSTAHDDTARIWDITNGRTLQTYKEPGGAPIGEARWSHSNRLLAIYGGDANIYILDAQTLQVKQTIAAGVTYSQDWSPDDTMLATANYDKLVRIWRVNIP